MIGNLFGSVSTLGAAELTTVRMAVANTGINSMPYAIAKEKGFYQQEGLQLDLIVTSAPVGITAVRTGTIEFTGFAGTALGAIMQGAPLKIILSLSKKPKYWIFAAPELRTISELSGSTLAVGTRGAGPHIYALMILEKLGLAGKVNVMPLTGMTARAVVQLLVTGQVRAGYASDSTYYELKDRGFRELVNYADYIEEPSAAVAVARETIVNRPEMIQSFVNASYRGLQFFRQNRSESIAMMTKHMRTSTAIATRLYDLTIPAFGGDGIIGYAPLRKLLETRKEVLGLEPAVPPYASLVDDQFAARIPKSAARPAESSRSR